MEIETNTNNSDNNNDINEKMKQIIKTNFIFEKNSEKFLKDNLSPTALLKGNSLTLNKTRNIINCLNEYNMSKYTENEYLFQKSQEEAKKKIKIINNNENIKAKEDILEIIYSSLSYDNTNKYILLKSLNKLSKLGFKDEFIKLIKEYRMIISKDDIKEENIQYYEIKDLFIPKDEDELKKYLIEILIILVNLFDKNSRNIEKIVIEFELKDGILYFKNNTLNNNLEINNKDLFNFSKIYRQFKFIKKYFFNQPIIYESNNILYYNKIMNMIFDSFLNERNNNNTFSFNLVDNKLYNLINLKNFISDILIKQIKNNDKFTKELDLSLKFFLYATDSKFYGVIENIEKNFIIKLNANDSLNEKNVTDYFKNKKKIFDECIIEKDKFSIKKNEQILTFEYNKYNKFILDKIFNLVKFDLIEQEKYKTLYLENFQTENFFSKKEIEYLKNLLYHIINSNFFQKLIQLFSDKDLLPNDILRNKSIQDYIINNIIFLPYKEKDIDTQSITFYHNAQILVSGYPYGKNKYTNNNVYHLLELSRKLLQLIHEFIHSIKRYLNICTNGIISSNTIDKTGNNEEEAGYLFELYLFNWRNENYSKFEKLFVDRKLNENLKNGFIDMYTALNLLNPDLYNNDINTIRNILYKNIEFNQEIKNIELKNILSDMGYNNNEKIEDFKKGKSKIYASRYNLNPNIINAQFKCGTKHI